MLREKKRILGLILALSTILSCFVYVQADEFEINGKYGGYETTLMSAASDEQYGNLYYKTLDDGTISITDCEDNSVEAVIPSSINGTEVTAIGNGAFAGQTVLKKLHIPDSVTDIGDRAFLDCKTLNEISIDDNSEKYKLSDGALFTADGTELILAPRDIAGEYTIPDGVEKVGSSAFDCCYNLEKVNFPQGIRYLETCAFSECTSIKEAEIPFARGYIIENGNGNGTTYPSYVETGAFWGCTSLTSVSFPITYSYWQDSYVYIYSLAFQHCVNLKSVYISSAIGSISGDAFDDCPKLRNVYYEGTETEWLSESWFEEDFLNQITVCCNYPPYTPVNGKNYIITDLKKTGSYVDITIEYNETIYGGQTLIVACYDSGGCLIRYLPIIIGFGDGNSSCGVYVGDAASVKAFVWNNIGSMTPASNSAELILSTASPSPTPKVTATSAPTPSPTPKVTATSAPTPSPTPKVTATSAPTPSPTPKVTATPTPTPTATPSAADYEAQVVELVNEYRQAEGLSALSVDSALTAAAEERAKEIVETFSHTRPDGTKCFTILDEYGISYTAAGENIAYGQTSSEAVMNSWMNSTGHRANILKSNYTKIGVGFYNSGGVYYWVQLFIG